MQIGLSDGDEVFVECEGFCVVLGLYCIGLSELELGMSDDAGTSLEGERNGDGVDERPFVVIYLYGLVFCDVDADKQGCGLCGSLLGGHGWHFAHACSNGEDFPT